jgi:hypothetical protein
MLKIIFHFLFFVTIDLQCGYLTEINDHFAGGTYHNER